MFNLSNLVQKAQSFIEPSLSLASPSSDRRPSKAALFRHQFRLPESQNPLQEIAAELTLPGHHTTRTSTDSQHADRHQGNHYVGKLHLSEQFLCFSTQGSSFLSTASLSASSVFTGQTHGAGPAGNGFTIPLCAVRRVERLHSQSYMFALAITTINGMVDANRAKKEGIVPQKLTIQLAGSRQQCERFCDALKRGLREGVKDVENLKTVVQTCYSEYLLSDDASVKDGDTPKRQPPDTGLGMQFKYPGNPRKLREPTKIRLWREYLRGMLLLGSTVDGELIPSRERPKRNTHSPTYIPQAHPCRSTKPPKRRNMGAYLWIIRSPPPKPQTVRRDALEEHRTGIAGYR